jgi:hypothetical protein
MVRQTSCLAAFVCVVLVSTAQGQLVLVSPYEQASGLFGWSVSHAGDVNGDGCGDVVVGAPQESPGTSPDSAGRAYVLSGSTGAVIHCLTSPTEEVDGRFGTTVSCAGDVNGDGVADIVVGACREDPGLTPADAGRAYIVDGATGSVLHSVASPCQEASGHFGTSAADLGDVNGDGYGDVLIGAPEEDPGASPVDAGRAHIFSGTGSPVHALQSPNEEAWGAFGRCVASAGDVDGDGVGDAIVGAPLEDPGPSPMNAGRAYVFSGATGLLIQTLASPSEEVSGQFGAAVAGVGDVDGDRYGDLAVGAPHEDPGPSPDDAGRVYLFSGFSGTLLRAIASPGEEYGGRFGMSLSAVGDAAGSWDLVVAAGAPYEDTPSGPTDAGHLHIHSATTGAFILSLCSPNGEAAGFFGHCVAAAGDINGDGASDMIVGAPHEGPGTSPSDAGRAYLFTPAVRLSGALVGGQLSLQWAPCPGADAYWVYGADNLAYFQPGFSPAYLHRLVVLPGAVTTWLTAAGVHDPAHNWTYSIAGIDSAPAMGTDIELVYDDGDPYSGYYWATAGDGSGVRMTPPQYPAKIVGLSYYISDLDAGGTGGNGSFAARAYDFMAGPGAQLLSVNVTPAETGWVHVDVSSQNVSVNREFVAAMIYDGVNTPSFGYDPVDNNRAWDRWQGSWSPWPETYFMRATVHTAAQPDTQLVICTSNRFGEHDFSTAAYAERRGGGDSPIHERKEADRSSSAGAL